MKGLLYKEVVSLLGLYKKNLTLVAVIYGALSVMTKIGKIKTPSRVLYACDNDGNQLMGEAYSAAVEMYVGGVWLTTSVHYRHGGKVNIIYCDGHVAPHQRWLKHNPELFKLWDGYKLLWD